MPLAVALAFGTADTANAQETFNSIGSGQWVGVHPDAYDNRGYVGDPQLDALSSAYRGTRWNNESRWTFSIPGNIYGQFLSYPGSETTGSDYSTIGGTVTDIVNILSGHHITLDAPFAGQGYGEFGKVGELNIKSGGTLSILSSTVGSSGTVDNAGTLNISGTTHIHADSLFKNSGTTNITGSGEVTAVAVDNTGTINITDSTNRIDAGIFTNGTSGILSLTNSKATFGNFVNDGTVVLNNSTLIGSTGTGIQLANDSNVEFKGTDNAIEGTVSIADTVNFKGETQASTISLDNANFSGGSTTLKFTDTETSLGSGTSLAGISNVIANNNARINGVGNSTTDFVMNSGSWLRPGNSIGTFNVNNITFNDGTFIYIEADFGAATNQLDKILASGNINFAANGTTTIIVGTVSGDTGTSGDTVTGNILEAGGTIQVDGTNLDMLMVDQSTMTIESGTAKIVIESADDSVLGLTTVTATGTTLELGLTKLGDGDTSDPSAPPADPSGPGGATQMSSNLDTLRDVVIDNMKGSALHSEIINQAGGNKDAQNALLSQLDPVALSLGAIYTEHTISHFNRLTYDRVRFGTKKQGHSGYRGQVACDPCDQVGCDPCGPCGLGLFGSAPRELWFQGQAGIIDKNDARGIAGYDTNVYGYALGMDKKLSRNTIVGLGFGNSFYETKMNRGLGSADTTTYLFSVYGGHREGDWQLSGSMGYVLSDLESFRKVDAIGGYANGDRNADSFFGAFELARQFGNDHAYLTPFLGYNFISYREEQFTETGNLIDMTVQKRKVDAYMQTLGARIGSTYVNRNGWLVNPAVTMGWVHDYGKGQTITTGAFNLAPTQLMVLDGTSRQKDRALIGLSVNTEVRKGLTLFGRYDGELANRYNSQNFQAGMALQF